MTFFLERKKAKNFYVAGATSRWDVVQRPTEAAAETGAGRALARSHAMDLRPRFLARIPLPLAFFLTKKGKELLCRGRYVPVGRCPAPDRGGSRDRRLTRLYLAGYSGFVSAVLGGIRVVSLGPPLS